MQLLLLVAPILLGTSMIVVPIVFGYWWKKLAVWLAAKLTILSTMQLAFAGVMGLFAVLALEATLYVFGVEWVNQYSESRMVVTQNSVSMMLVVTAIFYIPTFAFMHNSNSVS